MIRSFQKKNEKNEKFVAIFVLFDQFSIFIRIVDNFIDFVFVNFAKSFFDKTFFDFSSFFFNFRMLRRRHKLKTFDVFDKNC